MNALLWCEWDLLVCWLSGWRRVGRDDLAAVSGTGRQHAVVSNEIEPWRGYEGGEFFDQLEG